MGFWPGLWPERIGTFEAGSISLANLGGVAPRRAVCGTKAVILAVLLDGSFVHSSHRWVAECREAATRTNASSRARNCELGAHNPCQLTGCAGCFPQAV